MQNMITISHNDYCPEMLAAIRRGPFAKPTEDEMVEYILTRVRRCVSQGARLNVHSVADATVPACYAKSTKTHLTHCEIPGTHGPTPDAWCVP